MTAAGLEPTAVSGPWFVDDLPDPEYHAHPAFSSTGAREILPPSCPALFLHRRDNPVTKPVFDLGKAAHRLVLGVGAELVVIDAPDWRTKAAREARDEAIAAGQVPLLPDDHTVVERMAAALRAHPQAGPLLALPGVPERSLFWTDPDTGVECRARTDLMLNPAPGRRDVILDYKTARSADPATFGRTVAEYGFHQQQAWYLDAARANGLVGDDAVFLFVVQEKTPPFLVSVIELDAVAARIGRERNARARAVYAECTQTGSWPGYAADVAVASLPRWAEIQHEEDYQS
jgi:hypothetical protein